MALVLVDDAAVVVGIGKFRIELDRLGKIGDGEVVEAFVVVGEAVVVVGLG